MTAQIDDNGQILTVATSGMSLRDKFAESAMQGLLANPNVSSHNPSRGWTLVNATQDELSDYCYMQADAMLKAREEK